MQPVPRPAPCLLSMTRCIARVRFYDAAGSRLDVFWPTESPALPGASFGPYSACPCGHGRWVDARDLRLGDELFVRKGRTARIETIVEEVIDVDVFNFNVSETNNYCVGENELLVHNRPPERAPKQGGGGKEGATNIPTWARGERPRGNEDGKAFAKRLCDERFGPGKYDTGTRSDFNQLKKYGDRHFVRPDRPKPGPKSGGDQKLEPQ
jgi:hypothetical protein